MLSHLKTYRETKPYQCSHCDKEFSRQVILSRHVQIHHVMEKPNQFSQFEIILSYNNDIIHHQRIQIGHQTYQCSYCEKTFTSDGDLRIHMKKHTRKSYKCSQCEKIFSKRSRLVYHWRTHSGEKPYQCNICDKVFSMNGSLSIHMRSHIQNTLYQCQLCDKAFPRNIVLIYHMRTHTGEKPYKCNQCGKAFSLNFYLQ
ncbi:unnamed protein product, partial [Meganyctiphanes norvegica]